MKKRGARSIYGYVDAQLVVLELLGFPTELPDLPDAGVSAEAHELGPAVEQGVHGGDHHQLPARSTGPPSLSSELVDFCDLRCPRGLRCPSKKPNVYKKERPAMSGRKTKRF